MQVTYFRSGPFMLFQSGGDKSKLFYTFNKYISYIIDSVVSYTSTVISQIFTKKYRQKLPRLDEIWNDYESL